MLRRCSDYLPRSTHVSAGYNRLDQNPGRTNLLFPGLTAFHNISIQDVALNLGSSPAIGRSRANTYQLTGSAEWTMNRNHFTFGADARDLRSGFGNFSSASGNLAYSSLQRFLLDLPPDVLAQRSFGGTEFTGNQKLFYVYAQDMVKVSSHLDVEAGLGYQYATIPKSLRNQSVFSGLMRSRIDRSQRT